MLEKQKSPVSKKINQEAKPNPVAAAGKPFVHRGPLTLP